MPLPFDHVVSIGRSCQSAWQLRRITGRPEAQALDWLISTHVSVVNVLRLGLDGWFDRDRLIPGPDGCHDDRVTGLRFLHEFEKGATLEQGLATHSARNAVLAGRWAKLMAANGSALFVRHCFEDKPAQAAAREIRDALAQAAPGLKSHLLYLVQPGDHDPAWQDDAITYAPLSQPEPYDWRGDHESWERALALCGVRARKPDLA